MLANPVESQRTIEQYAIEKGAIPVNFSIKDLGNFSILLETKRRAQMVRDRRDFSWIDDVEEIIYLPYISFVDNGLTVDHLKLIKEVTVEKKKYTVIRCEPHSEIAGTYLYVVMGIKL